MSTAENDSPFGTLPNSILFKLFDSIKYKPASIIKNAGLVCRRWKWISQVVNERTIQIYGDGAMNEILGIHGCLRLESLQIQWVSGPTVMTFLECGSETVETLTISASSMQGISIDQLQQIVPQIRWTNLTELTLVTEVPDSDSPRVVDVENAGRVANTVIVADTGIEANANTENDADTGIAAKTVHDADTGINANTENDASIDEGFNPDDDVLANFDKELYRHARAIEEFLRAATMRKLKTFTFCIQQSSNEAVGPMTSSTMSEFTGFIERHASTLKELSMEISVDGFEIPAFSLTGPLFSAERQDSIGHALNLDTLLISYDDFDFMNDVVPSFVWKTGTLKKLTLSGDPSTGGGRPGSHSPFQEIVQKCHSTLAEVSLRSIFVDAFQLEWLEDCSGLRKLSIYGLFDSLNVHVHLPQVTSFLVMNPTVDFPGDVSAWITQTFQNLEQLSIFKVSGEDIENCQWLTNLFPLAKLQKIEYIWDNETVNGNEYPTGPVQIFCGQNSTRFVHDEGCTPEVRVLHPDPVPIFEPIVN